MEPMAVIKYTAIALVVLLGLAILGLVTYSYLFVESAKRFPDIKEVVTSDLIAKTSRGAFLDKQAQVRADITAPQLGYLAPDFELLDFEGRAVRLSDFRGKPVLLNFWATWCPPCRKEMPDLERFHEQYGDKIAVLGINWNDPPAEALEFLKSYEVTYPNAVDRDGKVFVGYQLVALPTSFWIDEAGVIRGYWLGPMSTDTMVQGFQKTTHALEGEQ
jgi:cytochrome c biogenesis protein CcmG/thiol:disulfide interchange protein DsbE